MAYRQDTANGSQLPIEELTFHTMAGWMAYLCYLNAAVQFQRDFEPLFF
jgi:hypothetical protein